VVLVAGNHGSSEGIERAVREDTALQKDWFAWASPQKGVGMKKRLLTALTGALVLGAVAAPSAGARADTTITETCTDGTILTMDANARNGITTAETHYNAHNPSNTVCSIVP
jgi:hypothetical protein